MANTITVVPGNTFLSALGNLFLTVLAIVIFFAAIVALADLVGARKYVPFAPQA